MTTLPFSPISATATVSTQAVADPASLASRHWPLLLPCPTIRLALLLLLDMMAAAAGGGNARPNLGELRLAYELLIAGG